MVDTTEEGRAFGMELKHGAGRQASVVGVAVDWGVACFGVPVTLRSTTVIMADPHSRHPAVLERIWLGTIGRVCWFVVR